MRWLKLFILFFLFISLPSHADEWSELKSRYLTLRNTDATVSDVKAWEKLAHEFVEFAAKNQKVAPSALNNAAILYEELYKSQPAETNYLNLAIKQYESIVKDFPQSDLADDALYKQAQLLEGTQGVEELYKRIVEEYSSSDMHDVALLRLKGNVTEGQNEEELKHPLVILDPGHGGEDFGAVGVAGLLEKDVVLAIALEAEKLLKERNIGVRLTRRSDEFVPLSVRTALSNETKAELFISLHVNAEAYGKATGLEVYYLDNSADNASKQMAERENASVKYEGEAADLYFMLSDMIQNAKIDESITLANNLNRQLISSLKPEWKVRSRGVKKAPFYVLVGTHSPSVLLELFFISNKDEGKNLGKPEFRHALAEALVDGIEAFLKKG